MKTVLLAGGLGSRLSEETQTRPKPMVEIGGNPILWHIMQMYGHHGLTDFVVCLGYKGYYIKEYFANYVMHRSDLTVDLGAGTIAYERGDAVPNWRITLVDTGADTMTGGRLKRVGHLLDPGEAFCMTYGDGVSDVDITASIAFHRAQGRQATVTAVRPPGRYGATVIDGDRVVRFEEKPAGDGGRINGGFFVLQPEVLDRIESDAMPFEEAPLTGLAADGQLSAFLHDGFWQPMDTLRDKTQLEELWASGTPPWKTW
ncbi:MAG: glucose-1-phosphate cytidylyltransferase [Pseudomonadota bacterium]